MNALVGVSIQSTAGAVPVKNVKGELSMQKVKVHRYVCGKRPDYAPMSSSEAESEEDDFIDQKRRRPRRRDSPSPTLMDDESDAEEVDDPRLRRLKSRKIEERADESEEETRMQRHRHIHVPEVMETAESDDEREGRQGGRQVERHDGAETSEEEEEDDLSDDEIEKRRMMLRQKMLQRKVQQEPEIMDQEEEGQSPVASDTESSDYEECTDSEEETGPRLKPVFVRKKDRVTIIEKEREVIKQKQIELEAKKMAEERRKYTLKIVEEEIRKETLVNNDTNEPSLMDVNTEDENDEVEYEAWKLRELKRVKRDRDEREQVERERLEIDRLRNMTEEERRLELRNNPKLVTNKASKGKYKFLQKYYHRGAFYLEQDDDLYKRDFSAATLEDHFDKTILPKVMQVKNFGRSGRTKYTHLVDQDTTQFDSPWISESAQNIKFHNNQAAGLKQSFEKPSRSKRK